MRPLDDTIVAVASPPGGAARGIVRLSGPQAQAIVDRLVSQTSQAVTCPPPQPPSRERERGACFNTRAEPCVATVELQLDSVASSLPADLYLWPAGRSYTGQAAAEIHTFGSPPLLDALVQELCRGGARLAEPGEFTLRAFLTGRLDLTQAEAVLGVIEADDRRQLDAALRQLAGGLAAPLARLRAALVELLADIEAGLDFAEEDIRFITAEEIDRRLQAAEADVARLLETMTGRTASRAAVRAVLTGRPNAGKSSLFNVLVGRAGAIVSEQAGTTRDYLVAQLDLDGMAIELIDTPGHNTHTNAADELAQAGQAVAASQAVAADVRIVCLDGSRPPDVWDTEQLARPSDALRIVVSMKCDLAGTFPSSADCLRTSSQTGEGLDALRIALRAAAVAAQGSGDAVVATAVRCHEALRRAQAALVHARSANATEQGEEIVAEEMRRALDELGRIVGAVYTEDLLQDIFSRFCVGK